MTAWLTFRKDNQGIDCANCEQLIERGEAEDLQECCLTGDCTLPVADGGLGVIELSPLNQRVVAFYALCRELTPPLALALDDLTWHPDKGVLAQQLMLLAQELGAPWRPDASPLG